jgi:signal transduction histidine kinase/ligand-binding sensor domain-containing protein
MLSFIHRREDRAPSFCTRPSLSARALTCIVIACVMLACGQRARAQGPTLAVSQYAHTTWRVRDGFFKGAVWAIVQTPDGYIWLGTEFGLLRFDGVRAVPWQPPANQALPSTDILSLLVARNGTLWIGTAKGLASLKDGRLEKYAELEGQFVFRLLEDHEGTVWASAWALTTGRLCAVSNGRVQCTGSNGEIGSNAPDLYEDSKHNLWAAVQNGLWRWKPGPPKFYSVPGEPNGIHGVAEDDDGTLLIGTHSGIRRFVDGKTEPYPLSGTVQQFQTTKLLRDHYGGLWIGTSEHGVIHAHQRTTDVFGPSAGLSGNDVVTLFEDRESNVWMSTVNGLDRFRDLAVATLSLEGGLSNTVASVLADKDGSVWIATYVGLNRWKDGQLSTFGGGDGRLNGLAPRSLFQDSHGRIWVATVGAFGYLENDHFIPVNGFPGGSVHGIAEDGTGDLWVANQERGLFRLSQRNEVQQIPWASLGMKDNAVAIAADPLHRGLWVGFFQGGVVYFSDGQVRATYTSADGLGEGTVNRFQFDPDGTLWAATEGGLSRLKNGHLATLTSKNGLPCDAVHWVIEDNDHAFWLFTPCGLVRVARSEIDAWAAAIDHNGTSKRTIQASVLDNSDGVTSQSIPYYYRPQVTKSSDGKLWFVNLEGVSAFDPRHLPFNNVPPEVHVEQITADRKKYDPASFEDGYISLPPRVRDLAIDFTALSFVAPEKVHFRFRLEGQDTDWREVVNSRHVEYSNLAPKRYRFLVEACNNSGVWSKAAASLDFSVAPAFFQTNWFRLLCVVGFLVAIWVIYQLRTQQLERQFNLGLEARVNERTRIARNLHDTLLQTLHGLLFQFQAVRNLLPRRTDEAMVSLDDAIHETEKALSESRDAIQGLRSEPIAKGNLAELLTATSRELAHSTAPSQEPPVFDLLEEGEQQNLSPVTKNEVCRIALEILRNAYRHAQAGRVETEVRYEDHALRIRIRDDGKGIDPKVLKEGGPAGHWGLRGIRERATRIGAQLDFWSETGRGTEVQLTVPASVAYESARGHKGNIAS